MAFVLTLSELHTAKMNYPVQSGVGGVIMRASRQARQLVCDHLSPIRIGAPDKAVTKKMLDRVSPRYLIEPARVMQCDRPCLTRE